MSIPLPHCAYCPDWLRRLDGCPLLNINAILYKSGETVQSSYQTMQIYLAQDSHFHLDIFLALISLWVFV